MVWGKNRPLVLLSLYSSTSLIPLLINAPISQELTSRQLIPYPTWHGINFRNLSLQPQLTLDDPKASSNLQGFPLAFTGTLSPLPRSPRSSIPLNVSQSTSCNSSDLGNQVSPVLLMPLTTTPSRNTPSHMRQRIVHTTNGF